MVTIKAHKFSMEKLNAFYIRPQINWQEEYLQGKLRLS